MQMSVDDEILELLDETDITLTPSVVSYNINRDRPTVNERLIELENRGFVDRPKRGYYTITDRGRQYLAGNLDASDF